MPEHYTWVDRLYERIFGKSKTLSERIEERKKRYLLEKQQADAIIVGHQLLAFMAERKYAALCEWQEIQNSKGTSHD